MKRESRNLDEAPDVVLDPAPIPMTKYWLRDGPCDGTMVEIPVGTVEVYANIPAAELSLNAKECMPRVAVYTVDANAAGGGFHVLRFTETRY